MPLDQQKALLFGSAAAVRLLLFTAFPSLPNRLAGRVEVSTPVTSFKRREWLTPSIIEEIYSLNSYSPRRPLPLYAQCLAVRRRRVPPGTPPSPAILTPAESVILPFRDECALHHGGLVERSCSGSNCRERAVSCDSAVQIFAERLALEQCGHCGRVRLPGPPRSLKLIARSFLFNPFTVATCIARSTSALTNLFILTAMAKASQGASFTFVLALSFASYLAMHPLLLFPPLLVLLYDARASKTKSAPSPFLFSVVHTLGLAAAVCALLFVSALLTGSWDFLAATYGVRLLLPDLTPNVGLWWYFFTEMFDSFREFFLGVFWLHVASYMPGLTIRLRKQPLFVATTLTGIFAIFTPYPSIADATLYLSLVPLFRHLFPCKCLPKSSQMSID